MEIRKFSKETDSFQELSELSKMGLGGNEPEYWEWKYEEENGFDKKQMFVMTDGDKKIAMMGYLPMHYIDGKGEIHKLAQLCDLVVHPDYRGGGKFYQMTEAMKKEAELKGYEGFCGFPNANSTHGFDRLGYTLMPLNSYPLKGNKFRILLHKLGLGRKIGKTNFRVEILSENIGEFAHKLSEKGRWISTNSTHLHINKEFIKWRCDDYKGVDYRSITLYDGEKLVAFFIILVTKGRVKTAVKVVSFDILESYMENADKIAEDFKKSAYTIGDLIDFYGVWNKEIEEKAVKIFGIEDKIESNYKFILKQFGDEKIDVDTLFVNHIDSEL